MLAAHSFADLLAQLRCQDRAAVAAVFRRYRHRLIDLAQKQFAVAWSSYATGRTARPGRTRTLPNLEN
jgi:hypothetical protein